MQDSFKKVKEEKMKDTKKEPIDSQLDKALRSHLKNSPHNVVKCEGFDPDLATAYVERTLGNLELNRYESHLADCKSCRQMTAEYVFLFAAELPAIEDPVAQIESQVKKVSEDTKKTGLSWESIKHWIFGSQVRWAVVAVLVLFASGAIWLFYTNKAIDQTATTPKTSVEKNSQQPENSVNKVNSETAKNSDPKVVETPMPQPTPDNVNKLLKQEQPVNKGENAQKPTQNNIIQPDKNELANKENKGNSIKLPSLSKEDNLPDVANNKGATPIPVIDPLQLPPPPPNEIAQNTEKNNLKENTTNSGSSKTPRANIGGVGLVDENVKDKRSIGGKTFLLKSGVWTDQEYVSDAKTKNLKKVEVKKGSEDYQKILASMPELKAYFGVGTLVTVVYKDTVYIVK